MWLQFIVRMLFGIELLQGYMCEQILIQTNIDNISLAAIILLLHR